MLFLWLSPGLPICLCSRCFWIHKPVSSVHILVVCIARSMVHPFPDIVLWPHAAWQFARPRRAGRPWLKVRTNVTTREIGLNPLTTAPPSYGRISTCDRLLPSNITAIHGPKLLRVTPSILPRRMLEMQLTVPGTTKGPHPAIHVA